MVSGLVQKQILPKKYWLAENELALTRIIPFVYGLFFYESEAT